MLSSRKDAAQAYNLVLNLKCIAVDFEKGAIAYILIKILIELFTLTLFFLHIFF